MKGIAIFATLFLSINLIDGQSFNSITSIASQIDSGNYYIFSNTQKATTFYTQAQATAKAINNDSLLARTYVGFAVLARLAGDFPKAFDFHQKSLNIHLQQGDQRFIAADYHNIGALFRYADDMEKAKQYFHKGRKIREAIQDSSELALTYMQLGIICRKMKQLDSTVYYYNNAFQLANALADRDLLTRVNGNWAALEHYQGNYQQAIERNLMDIPYLEATKQSKSLSTRFNNISRAYSELKNYPQAIEYMSKAIEIDEREDYKKDLYLHLLKRSTQRRKMGAYKAALSDYRRYKKVRDTVQNLERV